MKKQLWGLLLSVALCVAGTVNAWAQDAVDHETAKHVLTDVLEWTAAATAYDLPEQPPQIDFKSAVFFAEQVCSSHTQCLAMGSYRDGGNIIILHESYRDLSAIHARAMLVHEIVHFLQDLSGEWHGVSCKTMVEREREAYLIQFRYLIAEGGFPPYSLRLPAISEAACEFQPETVSGQMIRSETQAR